MSSFVVFVQLGLRHIVDAGAMDHILFLLALAAIYRFGEWRRIAWVVTAFTLGHSMALAAAVFGYLPLSQEVVEFLIPLTIIATCIENILVRERSRASLNAAYRPVFAAVFGLVHGAGFGGYLKDLFVDSVAVPLLGFNVGIELGQLAVLALIFVFIRVTDMTFRALMQRGTVKSVFRMRVVGISCAVMVVAIGWAFERSPW